MRHRSVLAALSISVAVLASCGSDTGAGASVVDSNNTPSSAPADTTPANPVPTEQVPTGDGVPADLADVAWLLDGHITVGGIQTYPPGTGAGLTFSADGTVQMDTGCNTGTAPVTFEGEHTVLIGPLTMTERACTDPNVTAVEQGMLFVLAEPLTWSVHDGIMVLIPQNITDTGLHFVPA